MKLGRLPHQPDRLVAAPAHRFGAVMPPARLDRSLIDFLPWMDGNDTLPNCTFVSLETAARGVAFLNGYELTVASGSAIAGYADFAGIDVHDTAALAATDGAEMLEVADWQAAHGFDIGFQSLVARVGTIPINRMALANGMARLGPLWIGIRLHEREMSTTDVWDIQDGRDDGALVGLHAVTPWTYAGLGDGSPVWIGTWGRWQPVTWAWLDARADEAHGAVWRQLARADGTFYAGVSADGLVQEL